MTKRQSWLLIITLAAALIGAAFVGAPQDGQSSKTIDDIFALLTNDEGESRLDLLELEIQHIREKVDLIEIVAQRMLDDQYGFFDEQVWSLDDIKFVLDLIDIKIDDIKEVTDCQGCP